MRDQRDRGVVQEQCAFNGAWGGGAKPSAFYVSSYFWDRATDAGIIGDKAAITWVLKPNDFGTAASKACASSVSTLSQHFPNVRTLLLSYTSLLRKGFLRHSCGGDTILTYSSRTVFILKGVDSQHSFLWRGRGSSIVLLYFYKADI